MSYLMTDNVPVVGSTVPTIIHPWKMLLDVCSKFLRAHTSMEYWWVGREGRLSGSDRTFSPVSLAWGSTMSCLLFTTVLACIERRRTRQPPNQCL